MKYRSSQGFTLIEVLVAMVVIGAGLLLAARMQMMSIQNTQGGYLRAQAANLSYEIVDRMRANIPATTGGQYDLASDDDTPDEINCQGGTANCTSAQMADYDLFWWRTTIARTLPSGSGNIATTDSGDFTTVTVQMTWVDPYTAIDGAEQIIIEAELPES